LVDQTLSQQLNGREYQTLKDKKPPIKALRSIVTLPGWSRKNRAKSQTGSDFTSNAGQNLHEIHLSRSAVVDGLRVADGPWNNPACFIVYSSGGYFAEWQAATAAA
jgi:hypothetical protein